MQKEILIQKEESDSVEILFDRYNAYLDILGYLMSEYNINDENNKLFNDKLDEVVQIYIDLEKLKQKIANKYRPGEEWIHYIFNFNNNSLVFSYD